MADIYPQSIAFRNKTTTIIWSDGTKTSATPSGSDRFDVEKGTLWCLAKKFFSTSKIVNAVFTATYFLGMTEGEMLWIVTTKCMPEKEVEGVLRFARTLV